MATITWVGPDDWEAFRDVRLRALADSPDAFAVTLAEAESQPESLWRERLSTGDPRLLALDDDGRPVAMGCLRVPPERSDQAYVWGMWTDPSHRGRGHARALLETLLAWARERDLDVTLQVTEGNATARELYVSFGFEPTGETEPLRPGAPLSVETMVLRRG
ncbi:GNAT family N-acetyltransferase [Nocardioides gansuensis]|nr:GNAT family N-acetyltransferase [Nocardioides gansuensis]